MSLSKQQGKFLLENVTERERLSSLMEHVAKEILKIRGEMSDFKELGQKIEREAKKRPSASPASTTTVFNVAYPENVIPMINVHGDSEGGDQTLNISGAPPSLSLSFSSHPKQPSDAEKDRQTDRQTNR